MLFLLVPSIGLLSGHCLFWAHNHIYFIWNAGAAIFRCNWQKTLRLSSCQFVYGLELGDHASESVGTYLLLSLRFISGNAIYVRVSILSWWWWWWGEVGIFFLISWMLIVFINQAWDFPTPCWGICVSNPTQAVAISCNPHHPGRPLEPCPGYRVLSLLCNLFLGWNLFFHYISVFKKFGVFL